MEESESCEGDSLSIYDGQSASAVLLDRLCGNKGSRRYMTSGDTLFVQFKANSKSSRRGFRAQFNIDHVCMLFFLFRPLTLKVSMDHYQLSRFVASFFI